MSEPEYVYVASSWRNYTQQAVVHALRRCGIDCYDFRNPDPGTPGFAWDDVDPGWRNWTTEEYVKLLNHPVAELGYTRDYDAMLRADTFVLVQPCGASAHLEFGWAVGAGKRTAVLLSDSDFRPDLMLKMADYLAPNLFNLLGWLGVGD